MFNTALCSLRVMRGFQMAQVTMLTGRHLSFEMLCALLNNNVNCYQQSLEFAADVQVRVSQRVRCGVEGTKGTTAWR
jgi:hypothetical protein